MPQTTLETLIASGRTNAIAAWVLVVAIAGIGLGELVIGVVLWTAFAVALVALALLPPIAFRSPLAMLPWEVLLLAALPVLGMALDVDGLTGHFASYLSVAAIALVLAVELQTFTAVRMTSGFAVVFVVVSTLSAAALWALLRWGVGGFFGVPFTASHDDLMWEFVYSAVAGLGSGVVFEAYFRRLDRLDQSHRIAASAANSRPERGATDAGPRSRSRGEDRPETTPGTASDAEADGEGTGAETERRAGGEDRA